MAGLSLTWPTRCRDQTRVDIRLAGGCDDQEVTEPECSVTKTLVSIDGQSAGRPCSNLSRKCSAFARVRVVGVHLPHSHIRNVW